MTSICSIEEAARVLREGKPLIFPTDTVYGLGVAVSFAPSPSQLFALKRRPQAKPVSWLVGSPGDLDRYGKKPPESARALARDFWPGPLTLIVEASDAVPAPYRSVAGSIGLRMPQSETALALIEAVGCPLATTSANVSGAAAPRQVSDIDAELAADAGLVLVADEATPASGLASTVVDCTGPAPAVLRRGAIGPELIAGYGR